MGEVDSDTCGWGSDELSTSFLLLSQLEGEDELELRVDVRLLMYELSNRCSV
jgi:hypothetical protein